jgi:hypothetical protein
MLPAIVASGFGEEIVGRISNPRVRVCAKGHDEVHSGTRQSSKAVVR